MYARALGTTIFSVALLLGANAALAQGTKSFDTCRADAIRQHISGDKLAAFLSECTGQRLPPQRASFERCRTDAIAQGHVGEARAAYVDECMQRSGSADQSAGEGTFHACRTQGRAQRLVGDQLADFVSNCMTH